jgi:hypothetical protein
VPHRLGNPVRRMEARGPMQRQDSVGLPGLALSHVWGGGHRLEHLTRAAPVPVRPFC